MRGSDTNSGSLFSYVDLEVRIPAKDRDNHSSCRRLPSNSAQLLNSMPISSLTPPPPTATLSNQRPPGAQQLRTALQLPIDDQATARIAATDMQCPARCRRTSPRASKSRIHFETVPL